MIGQTIDRRSQGHIHGNLLQPQAIANINIYIYIYIYMMEKTTTNNIPENAADIISPNLQESMRSNNQRAAITNHQKHK